MVSDYQSDALNFLESKTTSYFLDPRSSRSQRQVIPVEIDWQAICKHCRKTSISAMFKRFLSLPKIISKAEFVGETPRYEPNTL
jgi:hypothetical protein